MDRPEQAAAVAYLKRKGTEASAARLQAGLKATFRQFEQALDRVPEAVRSRRPSTSAWSIHEIVDHLVESHRPAVMELRDLCAGISPHGGPIPARLTSVDPFQRSWDVLVESLKQIHSDLLSVVAGADDAGVLAARAPFVMVVKTSGDAGSEILEWVEALDWKAYAQAVRVHTHDHLAQVERTVTVVLNNDYGRP